MQWLRRLRAELLPGKTREVRAAQIVVLAAFLVTFGVGCWLAEWLGWLVFAEPIWLGLVLLSGWLWWLHVQGWHGLRGWRANGALLVRLCVLGIFAMVLAEPRAVRESETLSVVFALDVSDSIGEEAVDQWLGYVMEVVSGKPAKDEAGLVVFGRGASVEMPPRTVFPFEAINSRVSPDGTNLEKALALSSAVLPEDNPGRIVLISDGTATEGGLASVLDELAARGVAVDVLPIDYAFENEVWIEKLELPKNVKANETYDVAVVVNALKAGRGRLVLRENGQVLGEPAEVDYEAGKNRYTLQVRMREAGYYEYSATIEPTTGGDGWAENNQMTDFLVLEGAGKVLLVTEPAGAGDLGDAAADPRDWETLQRAITRAPRMVDQVSAFDAPRSAVELLPYDAIVLANVGADKLDAVQMTAMRDAVFNLGVGLLMVGGQNSYGPGGYHRSPIEEALPVTMDVSHRKVLPKGALAIILHTCEFPQGNTWGKRITKAAMKVLSDEDEVGVLIYGQGAGAWGYQWLFPLTKASEYDTLVPKVNNAVIGDMPDFASTMKMGLNGLAASDASSKHMIIISDGDPQPPSPQLLRGYQNNGVTITTVSVFPHTYNMQPDIQVMKDIAAATGGKHYFPQNPNVLPQIFIKEAKTLKRSMLQNVSDGFVPSVEFPSPILKGIDALPKLYGYVLTSPKSRAEMILQGPESEEPDPVLATWRFGLGRSAAWTSDLAPRWGRDWVDWQQYETFVKQLLIDIARAKTQSSLLMDTFTAGGQGYIRVTDQAAEAGFLDIEALVSKPDGTSEAIKLRQTGPRRYEASFPVDAVGRYQVIARGRGAERNERTQGGFAVSYSPEYLRFEANPIVLEQIAETTGGRVLDETALAEAIFPEDRDPRRSSQPVFDWFLVILACLIPLDVAIRRVSIDWAWVAEKLRRKDESKTDAPTTATLGTLLNTKQKVADRLRGSDEDEPAHLRRRAGAGETTPETPDAPGQAESEEQAKPAAEPEDRTDRDSTMSKLLERKRKLREERDDA